MELSTPQLYSFAVLLLLRVAPAALVSSLVFWLARWRRISGVCMAVALLALLIGAVASLNPFRIAGYIAADGECAEE